MLIDNILVSATEFLTVKGHFVQEYARFIKEKTGISNEDLLRIFPVCLLHLSRNDKVGLYLQSAATVALQNITITLNRIRDLPELESIRDKYCVGKSEYEEYIDKMKSIDLEKILLEAVNARTIKNAFLLEKLYIQTILQPDDTKLFLDAYCKHSRPESYEQLLEFLIYEVHRTENSFFKKLAEKVLASYEADEFIEDSIENKNKETVITKLEQKLAEEKIGFKGPYCAVFYGR